METVCFICVSAYFTSVVFCDRSQAGVLYRNATVVLSIGIR